MEKSSSSSLLILQEAEQEGEQQQQPEREREKHLLRQRRRQFVAVEVEELQRAIIAHLFPYNRCAAISLSSSSSSVNARRFILGSCCLNHRSLQLFPSKSQKKYRISIFNVEIIEKELINLITRSSVQFIGVEIPILGAVEGDKLLEFGVLDGAPMASGAELGLAAAVGMHVGGILIVGFNGGVEIDEMIGAGIGGGEAPVFWCSGDGEISHAEKRHWRGGGRGE